MPRNDDAERDARIARARLTHAVEQSGAGLRNAATLLAEFWNGLVEQGVERSAATWITIEYMKHAMPRPAIEGPDA